MIGTCRQCGQPFRLAYATQRRTYCSPRCAQIARRGVRRTEPPLALCQRPGCENVRTVRNTWEQKRAKYCSRHCAGLMTKNLPQMSRSKRREYGRLGGLKSTQMRRAQMIAALKDLTPLDAYKKGRIEGWHAGYRRGLSKAVCAEDDKRRAG